MLFVCVEQNKVDNILIIKIFYIFEININFFIYCIYVVILCKKKIDLAFYFIRNIYFNFYYCFIWLLKLGIRNLIFFIYVLIQKYFVVSS